MIDITCQAVGPDSADVPKIDTCASSERTSVSPLKIIDIAQHIRIIMPICERTVITLSSLFNDTPELNLARISFASRRFRSVL